jgi:hypothetical protein
LLGAPIKTLVLYSLSSGNRNLSYHSGWPRQLASNPGFDCTMLNVSLAPLSRSLLLARVTRKYDLVLCLHSVFSNECLLTGSALRALRALRCPKVWFIGNEYKLMPEKMTFAEELGVDLLVSQIGNPAVLAMYRERLGCDVLSLPNAGLDPELFRPTTPLHERGIDLGYRGYEAALYLGHLDRTVLPQWFLEHEQELGLRLDISVSPEDRFDEPGWATFLNRCRGQLGCESGTDFFELTDDVRLRVNDFTNANPDATFEDVHERFFSRYGPRVSGRTLSGRIVEAAGTKTVQVLFEGRYDGFFEPDVHYIPLRKDFSNVDEAIAKLRDDETCRRLVDAAYEVAMERLTYARLLRDLRAAVSALAA